MNCPDKLRTQSGFSLLETLVAMAILIPIMGAAIGMFSVGANQQASEQSSVDANQEARSALEMMAVEIAQAGSNRDRTTTLAGNISSPNSAVAQAVSVASSTGIVPGDWIEVGTGLNGESVRVTAVGTNSISGAFRLTHSSGDPVRLFAFPFVDGVVRPTGMTANSSATTTAIRFFGDINTNSTGADSEIQFIEYIYDAANAQITRSATPFSQAEKNVAIPFVRNVVPNSVQFTLNTNAQNRVSSIDIAMTVKNTVKQGSKYQETSLSTKVVIPSIVAGSVLLNELTLLGGINKLPPAPARVSAWATGAQIL
jgi:type II secretory pathway pseudopilin PulG